MARFNVRGNEMMDDYARDLDIPFKRNGAMVVCIHESEKDGLKDLYDRGIANGVKGLEILDREQALEKEPNLSENVVAALYAPTSGIICPFLLNIAMAENANVNGVDFFFNTEVEKLTPATCEKCGQPIWKIRTNNAIERINREIRRRTRVVGTFPDGRSALMLVTARLKYVAESEWGSRRYLDVSLLHE